jgi:hypothetical protein
VETLHERRGQSPAGALTADRHTLGVDPTRGRIRCNQSQASRQSSSGSGNGCRGASRYSADTTTTPSSWAIAKHLRSSIAAAPITRPPPWIHSKAAPEPPPDGV